MKYHPFKHKGLDLNLETILDKKLQEYKKTINFRKCYLECRSGRWLLCITDSNNYQHTILNNNYMSYNKGLIEAILKLIDLTKK